VEKLSELVVVIVCPIIFSIGIGLLLDLLARKVKNKSK
jgi:hypothetical protein